MNIDKVIEQIEGKKTLLIFLRDNFPDVLQAWKNKIAGAGTPADVDTNSSFGKHRGDDIP